jgi:DNA (cytosine-5)-methyltransferase 1
MISSRTEDKKRAARRPIGIDLFAGAGGLSLGFEQGGFDVAAAVETSTTRTFTPRSSSGGATFPRGTVFLSARPSLAVK